MASQIWDTAQNIKSLAESIDEFLFVDGKTSPKTRQFRHHTQEEFQEFLNKVRESLWEEQTDLFKEMGY